MDRTTFMVSGYASAPAGTGLQAMYGSCGVVLEVDSRTHEIVDAEFTVVTALANRFLRSLLVGARLDRDAEQVTERLRQYYLAPSADAMVVAFRAATDRYRAQLQPPADRGPCTG